MAPCASLVCWAFTCADCRTYSAARASLSREGPSGSVPSRSKVSAASASAATRSCSAARVSNRATAWSLSTESPSRARMAAMTPSYGADSTVRLTGRISARTIFWREMPSEISTPLASACFGPAGFALSPAAAGAGRGGVSRSGDCASLAVASAASFDSLSGGRVVPAFRGCSAAAGPAPGCPDGAGLSSDFPASVGRTCPLAGGTGALGGATVACLGGAAAGLAGLGVSGGFGGVVAGTEGRAASGSGEEVVAGAAAGLAPVLAGEDVSGADGLPGAPA